MKAVVLRKFGSIENFEEADIPIPPVQKGQVRIEIKAVSFNPVDFQIRRGLPESKLVTSNILGRDLSGIVDEVYEDITDFKKGDEVYCYVCNLASSGTYTEYISVPSAIIAKKPVTLSHEEAAAVPVAGITASIALTKAKPRSSKSIFITGGAGGVGTFVIMLAKELGFENILTTAGNDKSLNYLTQNLRLKKEQVLNYRNDGFIKKAIERNNGPFDIVLDLVGGSMLSACCELLAIDGNLASIVDAPSQNDFEVLFQKNASFHSVGANAYSLSANPEEWKTYQHILNHIANLYESRRLNNPPITIVGDLSVDTVKKAHQLLENNLVQGKLIMAW